jgi:glycosyltransferase involved in cell wall biosynthesis
MSDHEITVLVPTYNHARYISQSIQSVMNQSAIASCKIIISDDCSSDHTYDTALRLTNGHSNVKVQRNSSNLGTMQHYARLVEAINTPYTAILEGDDVWIERRKLELQREFLTRNPRCAMCFSACTVEYEAEQIQVARPIWNDGRNRLLNAIDLVYENPVATFSNCLYRTAALKTAFLSPDRLVGYDWLCNMKVSMLGEIGFLALPCTLYRVHANGTWSSMSCHQKKKAIRQSLEAFAECASSDVRPFVNDAIRSLP